MGELGVVPVTEKDGGILITIYSFRTVLVAPDSSFTRRKGCHSAI